MSFLDKLFGGSNDSLESEKNKEKQADIQTKRVSPIDDNNESATTTTEPQLLENTKASLVQKEKILSEAQSSVASLQEKVDEAKATFNSQLHMLPNSADDPNLDDRLRAARAAQTTLEDYQKKLSTAENNLKQVKTEFDRAKTQAFEIEKVLNPKQISTENQVQVKKDKSEAQQTVNQSGKEAESNQRADKQTASNTSDSKLSSIEDVKKALQENKQRLSDLQVTIESLKAEKEQADKHVANSQGLVQQSAEEVKKNQQLYDNSKALYEGSGSADVDELLAPVNARLEESKSKQQAAQKDFEAASTNQKTIQSKKDKAENEYSNLQSVIDKLQGQLTLLNKEAQRLANKPVSPTPADKPIAAAPTSKFEKAKKQDNSKDKTNNRRSYHHYDLGKDHLLYAKYYSDDRNFVSFTTEDNTVIRQPKSYIEKNYSDLKIYDYLWFVHRKELNQYFVYDDGNLKLDGLLFAKYYKPGDLVDLPVIECDKDSVRVAIGPHFNSIIFNNNLPVGVKSEDLIVGRIYTFKVIKIREDSEKNRIYIDLSPVKIAGKSRKERIIDEGINNLYISEKNIEYIKNTSTVYPVLGQKILGELTSESLSAYIQDCFQKEKKQHSLFVNVTNRNMTIYVDLGVKDTNGVPLQAILNRRKDYDSYRLSRIDVADPAREWDRFVYVSDWDKITEELADLALPENWDAPDGKVGNRRFLGNYLQMKFYKSMIDGSLVEENGNAVFNTGLVDTNYEDIYCFLSKDKNINDSMEKKWQYKYFSCWGIGVHGKELNSLFKKRPKAPSYIDPNDTSNLFFNTEKYLSSDYVHIINDNLERLPKEFILSSLSYYDTDIEDFFKGKNPNWSGLKAHIMDNPQDIKELQDRLNNAVKVAKKRCKWNYKTATPIYYPKTNKLSLLLPLKLTKNKNTSADVALVVAENENGNYQGQTILTLDMAYQDARQICRLSNDWLNFDQISR